MEGREVNVGQRLCRAGSQIPKVLLADQRSGVFHWGYRTPPDVMCNAYFSLEFEDVPQLPERGIELHVEVVQNDF